MKNTKRKVEIVVLSDIYLGMRVCKAHELLNYLKSVKPDILILNGNVLDTRHLNTLSKLHLLVVNRLLKMLASGTRIYYLTGDYDRSLRRFADFGNGSFFLRDQLVLQVGGKKHWFFHGDMLDLMAGKSRWYQRLLMQRANWRSWFGKQLRLKPSKKWFSRPQAVQQFEDKAMQMATTEGYDVVICGNTHLPKMHSEGEITYLNAGDWVLNLTALEYAHGEWTMFEYQAEDFKPNAQKVNSETVFQDEDEEHKFLQSELSAATEFFKRPKEYVVVRPRFQAEMDDDRLFWNGIE